MQLEEAGSIPTQSRIWVGTWNRRIISTSVDKVNANLAKDKRVEERNMRPSEETESSSDGLVNGVSAEEDWKARGDFLWNPLHKVLNNKLRCGIEFFRIWEVNEGFRKNFLAKVSNRREKPSPDILKLLQYSNWYIIST